MRSISARSFHLWGLWLTGALLCALPATAQSRGEFTIPREVHWGRLVLPAGSYAFTVEHHATEVLFVRTKSGSDGHFLIATSISRSDTPAPSELKMERRGDEWYVTSIVVDDMGETLMFTAPPESKNAGAKLATIASK
jgi:hypothetical protein